MKYKTFDEFENFNFADTHINDVEASLSTFKLGLDNVIIRSENSKNKDIRDMRTNGLILSLKNASIVDFVREGFKTYDADGNYLSDTEDEKIEEDEYKDVFDQFIDASVYLIDKNDDTYNFIIDANDERTYVITVTAESDVCEWDKFMNIEM